MIAWDPARTISPHAIIVGSSGTGKTYRLRYILHHLVRMTPSPTIHILDVHGDIGPNARNRIVFGEQSPYGLNPLEIDLDPDFGGLRRKINGFISTINRTTHKLGIKQEAALRNLLEELYAHNGYDMRNPATWNPATNPRVCGRSAKTLRHPGITDLVQYTQWRMNNIALGLGSEAVRAIGDLNKQMSKLNKELRKEDDKPEAIKKLKDKIKEAACSYVDQIETGRELSEFVRFDSLETLTSIHERVRALEAAGIFKDAPPTFYPSDPVRLYDIKSLNDAEQIMFGEVLFERLFIEAKAGGIKDRPTQFIVIDEAHRFMSSEKDHVLNRMAREIRKYGVGLILVSQSFDHFPDDLIDNTGMTVILGLHDMRHERTAKKLGIERKRLKFIQPQKTALIQVRGASVGRSLSNTFHDIELVKHGA